MGNNEPHQVYVKVNTLNSWVCVPECTGAPCPHEWATVRSCDELSWPNTLHMQKSTTVKK